MSICLLSLCPKDSENPNIKYCITHKNQGKNCVVRSCDNAKFDPDSNLCCKSCFEDWTLNYYNLDKDNQEVWLKFLSDKNNPNY